MTDGLCPPRKHIIRIGQFTDSYPPIVNGVSTFVSEHHRALLARGIDAAAFTFSPPVAREPDGSSDTIYRTAGLNLLNQPFQANLRLSREARAAAAQLDIIHVHEPFVIANHAEQIAHKLRRPLIFTNHTRHDLYTRNYPRTVQPILRRYIDSRVAHMIRASVLASTPSHDAARWMRSLVPDLPAERVQVIRNGIDLRAFRALPRTLTRADLSIPPERTLLIYVGRLTPEKNLLVAAQAVRHVIESGADLGWLIVGEGPLRNELADCLAGVTERVHFAGSVPHHSIGAYLALADGFLTASLSEINPMSLIEALAFSLPYLGIHAPWWDEFESVPPAGRLAEADPLALSTAIADFCRSAAYRADLRAGAESLSQRFDIDAVTSRWIDLYEALMSELLFPGTNRNGHPIFSRR